MNLTQFMKRVNAAVQERSGEELGRFICGLARDFPEAGRERFLESLQKSSESALPALFPPDGHDNILARCSAMQEEFARIEDGTLYLEGEINEAYGSWHEDGAFLFRDPFEIGPLLDGACLLIHQCVDREIYREARALAEKLLSLDIPVRGDYEKYDGSPLSVWDLEERQILSVSLRQLSLDALAAVYQSAAPEERPGAVYDIFSMLERPVTLNDFLEKSRDELEEVPEFLDRWVDYLGEHGGRNVRTLLTEALRLQDDHDRLLDAARKYTRQHPQIYEQLLERGLDAGDDSGELEIGEEAIRMIPAKYVVRSRAALITAVHALRLNERERAERCWLEAFRSDTRPVHYLRLALNSKDFSVWRDEARRIYRELFSTPPEHGPYYVGNPSLPEKNRIDEKGYYALMFLDGDFRSVMKEGMNVRTPLGWSTTFMKEGLALFLLLLFPGENLPVGCRRLCGRLTEQMDFSAVDYARGLLEPVEKDDAGLFWDCFREWKKRFIPPEEEALAWMENLEQWISWRVDGIVRNQHRAQYDESAIFAAALGEVRESRGEEGGKSALLQKYKKAYPRHTGFHRELKAVGLTE